MAQFSSAHQNKLKYYITELSSTWADFLQNAPVATPATVQTLCNYYHRIILQLLQLIALNFRIGTKLTRASELDSMLSSTKVKVIALNVHKGWPKKWHSFLVRLNFIKY